MFYGDCSKDFAQNFGDRRTGCCIMTAHHLTLPFSAGNFFYQKPNDCHPHPPSSPDVPPCDFFLFSQLKGCHFDTIEAIKAEFQAVLNTVTEQNFQDAFKKMAEAWEPCILVEEDCFRGDSGQ
jgi:hypothetical protein